jgi:hypothetical protein
MVFSKIDQELQSLVVYLSRDVLHKSDQQSRLINILSQHTVQLKSVHGDERHHYIEQDIYENTHIQQLMLNKKLMKRNKAKTKNDFMRR